MTFLPIVNRELRVAARRPSTYWLRSVAGLLMVTAGAGLFAMVQGEPPKDVAMYLFLTLTGIAILSALLSGIRSTSDCLSQERREGTLGLLFLTDLRGYDVILGKLVGNSLNPFYSTVAVLPMLAVPMLMGSITPGEFGRMALVALSALFFSLTLGMLVSSFSRSAQQAAWTTALLLIVFTFLLPSYSLIFKTVRGASIPPWPLLPSVAFAYYGALEPIYSVSGKPFWYSLATVNIIAWSALAVASFVAPRTWQDKPGATGAFGWRSGLARLTYGNSEERGAFRRWALNQNPFFWLLARKRGKPYAVWGFLALVGCAWAWGLAKYRREWLNEGFYLGTALLLNFVLRCWFASEASRQLAEDKKGGALEVLLCSPLSVSDILRGQQLGLLRQFLWPTVVVLGLEAIFMRATAAENEGSPADVTYGLYACVMVMLVADLVALYWVGLWQGLTAKSQTLALNGTIARILVWPWAGFILVLAGLAIASVQNLNPPEPTWKFLLGAWFISGITADLVFASNSRQRLLKEFRLVAQMTYAKQAPWWATLFGSVPRPAPGEHADPGAKPT